jgi:ribosomal 30S subunit maturation factor RimM
MPASGASYDHRIGRVIRAHGLGGEVVLQLFRPRRVEPARTKWQKADPPQPAELELFDTRVEPHGVIAAKYVDGAHVILRLVDVDDRSAAERLVPSFFDVDPRRPPELVTDAIDRLFGARVFVDDADTPLGVVEDIRDNGAQPLLLVGDDDVMIPAVPPFLEAVEEDDDGPRVRVRSIPGLLEVNRT